MKYYMGISRVKTPKATITKGRGTALKRLMLAFTLTVSAMFVQALDFPHTDVNNIGCLNCHDLHTFEPGTPLLKIVNSIDPGNIDDTAFNNLCWSCHNDSVAPYRRPHSSYVIDNSYGDWAIECKTCHNPHYNPQLKQYGSESYLYTGYVTAVSASTLTSAGAGWTADEYAGRVVYPDVSQIGAGGNTPSYRIVSNSTNTLSVTIESGFSLTDVGVTAGDQFAILYGKLIREYIYTPNSGKKPVKFFRDTGTNSFADSDTIYNGVCQVCHTKPNHMRNDGSAPDQTHENIGGGTGRKCTEMCHLHIGGFGHGIGGDGQSCVKCHGHEKGTVYDPDRTRPYDPGDDNPDSLVSQGRGTSTPHSTHTESQAGILPESAAADDHRGPGIYCADCHDIDNIPNFKSGVDLNGDGKYDLSETDVCDDCHSPGGDYNGVNSQNGSVGAKQQWHTGGVYNADGTLKAGKEKWCAGCHDKEPSVIAHKNNVTAPNVIGDETADYKYGTGWGFYKTGHGLPSSSFIPSGGNAKPGPGRNCPDCHDTTLTHIDGNQRTFDCGATGTDCDPTEYQESYRLKRINGLDPMMIPFPQNTSPLMSTSYFRLCFSCHTTDQERWVGPKVAYDPNDPFWSTNMVTESAGVPINRHYLHMAEVNVERYPPDYDYTDRDPVTAGVQFNTTSRPTCVICHNVHGSDNLAMIRNGKLIDREPGIQIWYYNPDIVEITDQDAPSPEDLPLTSSTGTYWQSDYDSLLCIDCHGGWQTETRTPFNDLSTQPPILTWTGEQLYTTDGVNPNAGPGGTGFEFRVEYTDTNNQAPSFIQVWVDKNDDGDYLDLGEKIDLAEVTANDDNYYDGKVYAGTTTIDKSALAGGSDSIIPYYFQAQDTDANDAIGEATGVSTLYLTNGIPALAWTGEGGYSSDGVSPDYSANGANFEFRVNYIDTDPGECPPGASDIQVWIDANDDGDYVDGGEKLNMTAVDGGDSDCTDGKLYTYTAALSYAGDGDLNYRFYASDGTNTATGDPTSNNVVSVSASANYPPLLAHADGACRTDGVAPALGADGGDFVFTVNYTDGDNVAPSVIQVWIDKNDDGDYLDGAEKVALSEVDAGDTDYTDGKLYALSTPLPYPGGASDGILNYAFYAEDASETAVGVPTENRTLTIIDNALKVKPGGTGGWYGTIQSAVEASGTGAATILVYPNSDFTAATYAENVSVGTYIGQAQPNHTIQSVCGADLTIIDSPGSRAVYFAANNTNDVLDGFSLTGGSSQGVYVINSSNVSIKNSKVYGNPVGIEANGASPVNIENCKIYNNTTRGIFGANSTVGFNISGTEIYSNASPDAYINGPAIYFNGGTHSIDASFIHDHDVTDNPATSPAVEGKGTVHFVAATATITNTIFANNQGYNGGATYQNNGSVTYKNVTFVNNSADNVGGAMRICNPGFNIYNSIFWNNQAVNGAHNISKGCGNALVGAISYSSISTGAKYISTGAPFTLSDIFTISNSITPEVDPFFVDAASDDFHIEANSPLVNAASAGYAPAADYDGDVRPQGGADDIGADEVATDTGGINEPPVLSWTGETNYVGDGVNPDAAFSGSTFEFRVDYTDAEDSAPQTIQLWIDLDTDGAYGDGEKFDLDEDNAGDTTYSDGKRYYKQLVLTYVGGGDLNYRFYANDGTDEATGTPISPNTVSVLNNVPTLDWTGEANYNVDGVNPNSGVGGSNFEFRVDYTDADNTAPTPIEVWVDIDDSDSYDEGENYAMSVVGGSSAAPYDGDFTNGERYSVTIPVPYVGDGVISYRISASDGVDDATGTPNNDKELTVTRPVNDTATLTWLTEGCRTDGVAPAVGGTGANFHFAVEYTDNDNQAPGVIQVWLDENDDGSYGSSEKYDMTVDGGDSDYTNGEIYRVALPVSLAGDGVLNYRIYATDGLEEATGEGATGGTLTVMTATKVKPADEAGWGGSEWQTDIDTAIDNISTDAVPTVLVYSYEDLVTPASYSQVNMGLSKNDRVVKAVCGRDLTYIDAAITSAAKAFLVNANNNVTVDGFTLTGGTQYGWTNNGSTGNVIKNCRITGNADRGIYVGNGGSLDVEDTEIVSNGYGGAKLQAGTHSFKRTIFNDNGTSGLGSGGGINAYNAATITVENTVFANNRADSGGAIYWNGSGSLTFNNVTFAQNSATSSGGAINTCQPNNITANNSIFWGNTATNGWNIYKSCSGVYNNFMTVRYSHVETAGSYIGNGTITEVSNLPAPQDPLFVDDTNATLTDRDYHLQSSSPMIDLASATYAPADDLDGDARPMGNADDVGADEFLTPNNIPTLTWTGVAPYASDGVDPDSASNGSYFTFRVDYTDADNTAPTAIQVWIDMDDDAYYDDSEKFDLTAVDGDSDYTDGKLYEAASPIQLWYKGDGVLDYRFYAMDDADEATGAAATGATVTLTNTDPTLAWTGETNYTTDGIDPDTDSNKSTFVFRVDYSDTDNDPPTAIQVWIDLNDDTVYDDGEKYDMTAVDISDSDYTDGRRYIKSMMIPYAGDGTVKYRFYATDGGQDATGDPTADANLTITNVAPTLEWTGETNYTTDGANPDSGPGGTNFEFRVTYIDDDNNEPTKIQVWVDLDDNGGFSDDEKFAMSEDDYRDSDHTTYDNGGTNVRGKRYTKTLAIGHAGDGTLDYHFYATDGVAGATGDPTTAGQTISLTDGPPTLSWTGDTGYITDGINPDGGPSGMSFEFRVEYSDPENSGPDPIQVWVDLDDSGTYEEGEKFNMIQVDPIDSNFVDGKDYSKSLTLSATGDSTLKFRFYAYDGLADATGDPTVDNTVTLINSAPTLAWIGTGGFTSDGVDPDSAPGNSSFEFRVQYADDDDVPPASIQVWVDVNNNGSYEGGEQYDMTAVDAGDLVYWDGKDYTKSLTLSKIGDGIIDYRFYGYDGTDTATGAPVTDKTVTVTDTPIAGTVYTDEGTTTIADGATVHLIVNGASVATDTTVGGAYSFATAISAGDKAIVYIDGHASDGTTVTVLDPSGVSDLDIYADHLIVRHDYGASLTNADMTAAYYNDPDGEVLYTTDGGDNLTVSGTGTELMVWGGDTYAPGATIDTVHLDIDGTLSAGANAINVSGNWDATGGAFTSTGTVTFDAGSGTNTIIPGGIDASHDFQDIVFNDAAGTATFQLGGALDVDGTFTVTDGIFDTSVSSYAVTVAGGFTQSGGQVNGNASTFTVGGNFQVDGTVSSTGFNSASLVLNGAGSSITFNNLASWWANGFNNLTVGQSGVTDTLNDWLTVKDTLTIGSGELTGSATLALTKAGDVLSFDAASNLTIDTLMFLNYGGSQNLPTLTNGYGCDISIAGGSSQTVVQTGAVTLNTGKSLLITGDGNADRALTYDTAGYDLSVGSNITIGVGTDSAQKTLDGTNSTITLGGNFVLNDGGTPAAAFTSTGSTVVFNGASQSITGSVAFNNLTKNDGANDSTDVTLTFDNTATQTVNGILQLNGIDADDRVNLVSDSPGTQWSLVLAASSTKNVDYVEVQDSDASGSDAGKLPVAPTNSVDGGNNTDWFAVVNNAPDQPVNQNYKSGETNVTTTPTLNGSAYNDGDGDPHQASRFYVDDSDADCSTPEYDSGVLGAVISHTVSTALNNSQQYYWCVQYQDDNGAWSALSSSGSGFTTEAPAGPSVTVCDTGSPDYSSIQAAINAEADGTTIQVCAGTWSENIDFSVGTTPKNVTVKSESGAAVTTIQGAFTYTNDAVVSFEDGQSSSAVLDGFTINSQMNLNGNVRGIYIIGGATPTIKNCIIEGNDHGYGTGGGAMYIGGTGSGATVENTTIQNNTSMANLGGGGIYMAGTGTLTITSSTIASNSANTTNTSSAGGGMRIDSGTVNITGTTIKSNFVNAGYGGGGIYMAGTTLTLSKSFVLGNWIDGPSNWTDGGGINLYAGTASITNSVIAGNVSGYAYQSDGGGIFVNTGTTLNLYYSTVADNYTPRSGGGIYGGGTENIYNSIIWGNAYDHTGPAEIYGTIDTDTSNEYTSDPTFVSRSTASAATPTTNGDYNLQSGSGARNTGTNSPTDWTNEDIVGTGRPQEGTYDKGAYEYVP